MTQEDKELLFKDLCSRLPYGVKVESIFINPDTKEHKLCGIEVFDATSILMIRDGLGEFKPYLFPLSSMTEEQKSFFDSKHIEIDDYLGIIAPFSHVNCEEWDEVFCWLNAHHFDYRSLIEKELAIDATNLNIY